MLTQREKDGFHEIMQCMPTDELFSLSQTVTMKQVVVHSREDAVQSVLAYTLDAIELLNRKKMKREYLFKYLASSKVSIAPGAEKSKLSRKILEVWQSADLQNFASEQIEEESLSQIITTPSPQSENGDHQLAVAFSQWYFGMLNSHNPTTTSAPSTEYGAHHFYQDCRMQLLCATPHITQETYMGASLVAERLLAFVKEEQLVFNPNLDTGGVLGKSSPHGLCKVQVCGTIHQGSNVLGIFEQQFGLIRVPESQNWKVKFVNLKIGSNGITEKPTLEATQKHLAVES